MVFLFAFYFFDLCFYRIIISRGVYIADDTKCDGEVRERAVKSLGLDMPSLHILPGSVHHVSEYLFL